LISDIGLTEELFRQEYLWPGSILFQKKECCQNPDTGIEELLLPFPGRQLPQTCVCMPKAEWRLVEAFWRGLDNSGVLNETDFLRQEPLAVKGQRHLRRSPPRANS